MKSKFFPQIKNLIRFSKLQKSDTGKSSLIQQKRVEKIMHLTFFTGLPKCSEKLNSYRGKLKAACDRIYNYKH